MRALSFILLAALAGCAMRPTVNLSIDRPREYTVQAWGYPARDDVPGHASYYSLSINLDAAPPFAVVLPDGYRAHSKRIDAALLTEHFAPVTVNKQGRSTATLHHASKEARSWMIFSLQNDGHASSLSVYACGHTWADLFETPDGRQSFDFPIRQDDLVVLFNGPVRIGHDFVILGHSCD